jgi:hypothetical protein
MEDTSTQINLPKIDVFVSYRRKDSGSLAYALHKELTKRGLKHVFVDTRVIDGAGPFPDRLSYAIQSCKVFICLLGAETLDSEWVQKEIELAYKLKKPMIPVFQETYVPIKTDVSSGIERLLQHDGIKILDQTNLYIDEAISRLIDMIRKTPDYRQRSKQNSLYIALGIIVILSSIFFGQMLLKRFFEIDASTISTPTNVGASTALTTVAVNTPISPFVVRKFIGHTAQVLAVAFSIDGNLAITGSNDGTARIWNVQTGQQLGVYKHGSAVSSVAISPDNNYALTSSVSEENAAYLWDISSQNKVVEFKGHLDFLTSVAFSHDGTYVLTGSADNTARLWDAATGKLLKTFRGHTGYVYSVHFSQNDKNVLTASGDSTARIWDTSTGKVLHSFKHPSLVLSAVFSPDDKFVLTASYDKVRMWDIQSETETKTFTHESVDVSDVSVVFSNDGQYFLTVDKQSARLWSAITGQQIRFFVLNTSVSSQAAFSPDNQFILIGMDETDARLWQLGTPD